MARKAKITAGINDRSVDATKAQSGEGLPDDSSRALSGADEKQKARLRRSLDLETKRDAAEHEANPEAVPDGTFGAGENICRRCGGSGRLDGEICPDCSGSGKVTTPLGGG